MARSRNSCEASSIFTWIIFGIFTHTLITVTTHPVAPSGDPLNVISTPPNKVELTADNKYFEYTEGDIMNFTCKAIGGIPDNISILIDDKLYKDGALIQSIGYMVKATWHNNMKSVSCKAYHNELEMPLERTKQITVKYAPRFDNDVKNGMLTFTLKRRAPSNVSIVVRANPGLDSHQINCTENGKVLQQGEYRSWVNKITEDSWMIGLGVLYKTANDIKFYLRFSNTLGERQLQVNLKNEAEENGHWFWTLLGILLAIVTLVFLAWTCCFARTGKIKKGNLKLKTPILRKRVFKIGESTLNYIYTYKECPQISSVIDEAKVRKCDAWNENFEFPTPDLLKDLSAKTERKEKEDFEDWILIYCAQAKLFRIFNGFYGHVYFSPAKRQVVVACRSFIAVNCPSYSWSCNLFTRIAELDVNAACTLGENVKQFISEFDQPLQVLVTGHSLGGYLAQIVTHTMKKFHFKKGRLEVSPKKTVRPTAFVFNAPPCLRRIMVIDELAPMLDTVTTPVFNFLTDVGLVSNCSILGGHLGTLISIRECDLSDSSSWKLMKFAGTYDIDMCDDWDKFCPEKNRPQLTTLTNFNEKIMSWTNFDKTEVGIIDAQKTANTQFEMPKHTSQDGKIICEETNFRQFIPMLKFLHHSLDTRSPRHLTERFYSSCEKVEFKFNIRKNQEVCNMLKKDEKIWRFQSQWEKLTFAQILKNSLDSVLLVDIESFLNFDVNDDWFQSLVGTLLILAEDEKTLSVLHLVPKTLKIVYLCDASETVETTFKPLYLADLDENSREVVRKREVSFAGKMVEAKEIFEDNLIEEVSLENIINFSFGLQFSTDEYYVDQSIQDEKKNCYTNAAAFAKGIRESRNSFVLLSSNPGTGKSAAMKKISETYYNDLRGCFVLLLEFSEFVNEFRQIKQGSGSKDIRAPFNKHNVVETIQEKLKDKGTFTNLETLEKTFLKKLEKHKVIVIIDGFDAVCPKYFTEASELLKCLNENPVKIIAATRRDYESELIKKLRLCMEAIYKMAPLEYKQQEEIVKMHLAKREASESMLKEKEVLDKFRLIEGICDLVGIPLYLETLTLEFLCCENRNDFFKCHALMKMLVDRAFENAASFFIFTPKKEIENDVKKIENLIFEIVMRTSLATKDSKLVSKERFEEVTKNRVNFLCNFDGRPEFLYICFAKYIFSKLVADKIINGSISEKEDIKIINHIFETGLTIERQMLNQILMDHPTVSTIKCKKLDVQNAFINCLMDDLVHLGRLVMSKVYVNKTINYSGQKLTPLQWSEKLQRPDFVAMLLDMGAVRNAKTLPIHTAAKNGNLKDLQIEIKKGTAVDSLDEHGNTPLFYAILGDNLQLEIVEYLIKKSKDDLGDFLYTVISNVRNENTLKLVKAFVTQDTKLINQPLGSEKQTPLTLAVKNKKNDVVKYLITVGANATIKDEYGNTCLHFAAATGNLELVEYLLANSGNLSAKNIHQFTPRDVAENESHRDVVNFLMEKEDELNPGSP